MPVRRGRLDGIERVLIDANNLIGALAREPIDPARPGVGGGALVGRVRAALPASVRIDLVFDGPPDRGSPNGRIASGVWVHHGGRRSADDVIAGFLGETRLEEAVRILVVTDDRELRRRVRERGAETERTAWLIARFAGRDDGERGPGAPGRPPPAAARSLRPPAGRPAGPSGGPGEPPSDEEDERPGWRSGRGATRKKGPARRLPRAERGGGR